MKWKVCGLRDNIAEVAELSPDFMGFIFYQKSKRYVGKDFMRPDCKSAKAIGVFVNEEPEQVMSLSRGHQLDLVQLHGDESVVYCKQLASAGCEIIKVFSGNDLPNQQTLDAYAPYIKYYLFDTRGTSYGGTGKQFDWRQLERVKLSRPVFLSGGLDLNDVSAIHALPTDIFAIDVNSRFEDASGLKNIEKLKQLKTLL